MTKFAIIKDGIVDNIVLADEALGENWIACGDDVNIGYLWDGSAFSEPPKDYDAQWLVIRSQRNALLSSSDWTQLPDAPVNAADWATYRQALRDITNQSDPFAIIWPSAPE